MVLGNILNVFNWKKTMLLGYLFNRHMLTNMFDYVAFLNYNVTTLTEASYY